MKKLFFILSAFISIGLIGGFFYYAFPGVKNIFGSKAAKKDSIMVLENNLKEVPLENAESEKQNMAQEGGEAAKVPQNASADMGVVKNSQNTQEKAPAGTSEIKKVNEIKGGNIISKLVSWGFTNSTGRKIDTIILHTSYDAIGNDPYSVEGVIAEWKAAGVAPHYLIDRNGKTYQLVADNNIAYHAGVSSVPDGRKNVNDFSLGVEIINTQDGKFSDAQYSAINSLIASLKKKYQIKYILGHDDIAAGRKSDPWGIEWSKSVFS